MLLFFNNTTSFHRHGYLFQPDLQGGFAWGRDRLFCPSARNGSHTQFHGVWSSVHSAHHWLHSPKNLCVCEMPVVITALLKRKSNINPASNAPSPVLKSESHSPFYYWFHESGSRILSPQRPQPRKLQSRNLQAGQSGRENDRKRGMAREREWVKKEEKGREK